jgi:hypothetical protein
VIGGEATGSPGAGVSKSGAVSGADTGDVDAGRDELELSVEPDDSAFVPRAVDAIGTPRFGALRGVVRSTAGTCARVAFESLATDSTGVAATLASVSATPRPAVADDAGALVSATPVDTGSALFCLTAT